MLNYTYFGQTGRFTVSAAAHAATAGFCWLINPVGNSKVVRLKKVTLYASPVAATVFVTAPRIMAERVTFTGAATGARITAGKRLTVDDDPSAQMITISTGLVVTAGAGLHAFLVPAVLTAVAGFSPNPQIWEPAIEDQIDLTAGEGIVLRQPDAASASDTRMMTASFVWEEFV